MYLSGNRAGKFFQLQSVGKIALVRRHLLWR